MDRRNFLKSTFATAAAAASITVFDSPAKAQQKLTDPPFAPGKAVLKLCSQEGRLPGKSLKEKVENLIKYGAVGLEVGGGGLWNRVKEIQDAIAGTNIKIAAVCAADGPYIVPDEAQRRKAIDNAKKIMDAAGELGSTGVIMVPAFNGVKDQLVGKEAREMLVKQVLPELGEHAVKAKTRMLLEPLNRGEAYFLRQLADAASICRDVNSPGIALMGDFYHMYIEETSDMGAFISAGKYLHHVHLGSIKRKLPGQDERSFADGFRGLKVLGFQEYISLECGVVGDPVVEIPKCFRFLEKQWEEATIPSIG